MPWKTVVIPAMRTHPVARTVHIASACVAAHLDKPHTHADLSRLQGEVRNRNGTLVLVVEKLCGVIGKRLRNVY